MSRTEMAWTVLVLDAQGESNRVRQAVDSYLARPR